MKLICNLEKAEYNMFIIPIPDQEGEQLYTKFGKRILCIVNGNKAHSALQQRKDLGYYIMVGKGTKEKLQIEYGETFELKIQKDNSEYKAEMPEELEEVLNTDAEGLLLFESLTPGKKRSIIHVVGNAKQSTTRINRAIKIIDRLKMGIKDLKELIR